MSRVRTSRLLRSRVRTSRVRSSAARSHEVLPGRRHSPGVVAAALTGLALLAACGTTQAGSAATATAPLATTTPSTPTRTATPGTPAGPATAGTTTTAPVRVPLVLPSAGRIAGAVTGTVSGVVTLGLDQCLFLRTDAGQRFGLEGSLAEHVRSLIIGRGVPEPDTHRAPTDLPGTASVRITARGTVTTGASVCSASYRFVAASGTVVSAVRTAAP